jgi:small subunit ribosomal protein S9
MAYHGLGRRKRAIAQVLLTEKPGEYTINKLSLAAYFSTPALQSSALQALTITSQKEVFGIRGKVAGGGKQAQADAIKLAVARALVEFNPAFRKQLKDTGALTRDARIKERKKYGLKRARRAPQFSKR